MKKLLFTSFICMMTFFVNAQNKLLDLSVLPVNEPSNDSITVLIQFKANNIENIQQVNLFFESQGLMETVLQKTATVIQQGNLFYVELEDKQTPIKNYSFDIYCSLSKVQYDDMKHTRVVVKYKDNTSAFIVSNN